MSSVAAGLGNAVRRSHVPPAIASASLNSTIQPTNHPPQHRCPKPWCALGRSQQISGRVALAAPSSHCCCWPVSRGTFCPACPLGHKSSWSDSDSRLAGCMVCRGIGLRSLYTRHAHTHVRSHRSCTLTQIIMHTRSHRSPSFDACCSFQRL